MNPGDRPRRALLATIGVAVAVAAGTLVVVADTDPAAADELERFASCEALADWGASDSKADVDLGSTDGGDGAGVAEGAPAPDSLASDDAAVAPTGDDGAGSGTTGGDTAGERSSTVAADGTNVIVEGVDELDLVDRLDDGHVLVSAASRLSIVDLVDDRVVANLPIASTAEITYDRDNGIAWVVGADDADGRLTVGRVTVTPTSLVADASWSTDGSLVEARRVGDRLHLVASDGYSIAADGASTVLPFESGPVPCDQVLHPVAESDTTATLLVTLPAVGALQPEHATEVVGSGQQVHVTTTAAYLATPLYGEVVQTSIHRFDLDTLELTGSGRVDGTLLNEFSMSDFDGHLRVAVTDGQGGFGRAIEGDVVIPEVDPGEGTTGGDTGSGVAVDPVAPTEPEPATEPATEPDPATDPVPSTEAPAQPALNEVVVLDTEGTLDVVGRTPRFGHPGETLHGIRFAGAVAYAVTFLQTDPFYVLDLDDPADPKVAGEVELPGFSSYLHPVGEGLVAGFGPDADGGVAVKLFDVSDRSRPTVVDTLELGDESPVTYDHHAFVDLGEGRFAVPASAYREQRPDGCTPQRQAELRAEEARLNDEVNAIYSRSAVDAAGEARVRELQADQERLYQDGCLYPPSVAESSVVVVDTAGGRLQLVQRLGALRRAAGSSRAVQTDDGWALLTGNRWVVLDGGSGSEVADLELGPEATPRPVDLGGGPASTGAGSTGTVISD